MKTYSREEIDDWLDYWRNGQGCPPRHVFIDIISQLLRELDECRKETAKECIRIIENEDKRVLSCQTGEEKDYQIDTNIRMTTVLLPGIIDAIRQKHQVEG